MKKTDRPNRKVYFFRCRKCGRRLPDHAEAIVKPGVCVECYKAGD